MKSNSPYHTLGLSIFLLFSIPYVGKSQIASWDFNASGSAALNPVSMASNLTASVVSFGAGVGGLGNQAAGSGCGISYTSSGYSATLTLDDYWEFTLTPNTGYQVNVTSISFAARRSTTGPDDYSVRYSINNYATDLATGLNVIGESCSTQIPSITMTPSTSAVTFRIYFYGASNSAGTLRIDQLDVFGSNVLPVELTKFSSINNVNSLTLFWSTNTEFNNHYFSIEKSVKDFTFYEMGRIMGNGTSLTSNHYSFTDHSPQPGTNYYRLKQVDFNGTYTYSKVISVEFRPERKISIYPNPLQGTELTLQLNVADFDTDEVTLELFDQVGRLVRRLFVPISSKATAEIGALPAGFNVARVIAGNIVETMPLQVSR
jgi:hypothetical protein